MLCFGPFPALLLCRFFFVLWLLCFMLGRAFHGALVLGQSLMLEQLQRILPVCANMTYPDGYGERKLESLPPLGLTPRGSTQWSPVTGGSINTQESLARKGLTLSSNMYTDCAMPRGIHPRGWVVEKIHLSTSIMKTGGAIAITELNDCAQHCDAWCN